MSDEEDYDSAEDQDYVPTDGEEVSEEEHSGDEENLELLKDDDGETKNLPKKRKPKPGKKKAETRKRTGGIKLADEEVNTTVPEEKDEYSAALADKIREEQEEKKQDQQKKRADDLWSSFMSDVGPKKTTTPAKPSGTGSGLGSLTSVVKPLAGSPATKSPQVSTSSPAAVTSGTSKPPSTITVTKMYDFAGEAVKVTKKLDVNSKEGKAELRRQQEEESNPAAAEKPSPSTAAAAAGGLKRPGGGGLGGVLDKINKKPKLGTLEKSKMDWEEFKEKEGIDEELKIHNRGKQSYIERMNFLQRSDVRQFELEKNLRMNTSKR